MTGIETEVAYPPKGPSYFRDLAASMRGVADREVRERLERHADEIKRASPDLSRLDGIGGIVVPPLWMQRDTPKLTATLMPYVSAIRVIPLPAGTDSLSIPGPRRDPSIAYTFPPQPDRPVTEIDFDPDKVINAPVRTIVGQQGIASQLLDQSPIAFDAIIWRDLLADYANNLERQIIGGPGNNGQLLGARSGVPVLAPASERAADIYDAIWDAAKLIEHERKTPTAIIMHPRRWASMVDNLADDQWRDPTPRDTVGTAEVTSVLLFYRDDDSDPVGIPVIIDTNMIDEPPHVSRTLHVDFIHVMVAEDLALWQSGLRTRVLPMPLVPERATAADLILFQAYSYTAFTSQRWLSLVEVGGPALTAPTLEN